MKVDIVIPVYRPEGTFCLLLQRLQKQTFLINKLFLINTGEELWREAIKRYPIQRALKTLPFQYEIIHITKQEFDHGGTRKAGSLMSKADIVVFMTQDALPADRFLIEKLMAALKPENMEIPAVSYARQLPAKNCGVIERYTRRFNYPRESQRKGRDDIARLGIKTFFCSDVCAAYRRDIFIELGGFEEPLIFNEDMFYAAKAVNAGYLISYSSEARVIHSHNYTLKQQFRRNFDLAVSQSLHPEIFEQVSSEAEGFKLVKGTILYLCSIRKPWLVPKLAAQCAARYAGYFLGKHYKKLGRKLILLCTMNKEYWNKIWNRK